MGALPSQLFCFPTSPGHSFLTPDFSFSLVCSLRALFPGHFTHQLCSPYLLLLLSSLQVVLTRSRHADGFDLKKTPALLSISSSYGRGEWPSRASQWCPLPSSKLLHCNFKVVWRKQYPGDYQRRCREGPGFIWTLRPTFCKELWPGGTGSSCLPGHGAVVGKCYCR